MSLGMISSEQIDDYWVQNCRRRIFYAYPNGAAPLTGLLSMMTNEETPLPKFSWNEERWAAIKTQTTVTSAFSAGVAFYQAGTTTTLGGPATLSQFLPIRMLVADASNFQPDDVITIFSCDLTSGTEDLSGRITNTNSASTPNWVEFQLTNKTVLSTLLNTSSANINKWVYLTGSAYAEGSRSRTGRQIFPTTPENYTQIMKTPFELTRTALKEPLKYDKTGAYADVSKKNGIDHLSQIEFTAFFGKRAVTTAVDDDTGAIVRRGFTGGLKWFLEQWEWGSVANGGELEYGQAKIIDQTDWRTYTLKRIIKLGGLTITKVDLDDLHTRVFDRTNSSDWVKLCLCGSGYLGKIAACYEKQLQWTSLRENGYTGFDFRFQRQMSNAGEIWYKTHPLFNDPIMRNSAFYIDLGYMAYRPLTDTDTDIQTMIQLPDADKRKDQWITEYGFEIPFPEAFMYVENLGGVTL